MKLLSLSVFFVLGVASLAEVVSGFCLIKNDVEPNEYWYHCYRSSNYLADVKRAPVDIQRVTFSTAKIDVLRNKSFVRFGNTLEQLEINYSEIGEIEDNAFEGLTKLHTLRLTYSNLKIVKGVWFKGLTNLKRVYFRRNEIKKIENSFFSTVPPLEILEVSENELECLPVESFADFKTNEFKVEANPLSWVCLAQLMDWMSMRNIPRDYLGRNNPYVPLQLLDTCAEKLPKSQLTEESMKKCAENTVAGFLKPEDNYTVKDLCQFLKNNPSPYLVCPK